MFSSDRIPLAWTAPVLLLAVALAACSTAAGHLTYWPNDDLRSRGDYDSIEVYHFSFDAVAERLRLDEQPPAHDTIGVITYKGDANATCADCSDLQAALEAFWNYDESSVHTMKRRAYKMGGDALLLASPRIRRRGVWTLVSKLALEQSLAGRTKLAERLSRQVGDPWVAYAAYVISWDETGTR